jgi:hypothetical protein
VVGTDSIKTTLKGWHHQQITLAYTHATIPRDQFSWQNGYGAFSIGASQVESVRKYIAEQEQHHRRISFQDEFQMLLQRYGIEFDERYVWD